MAIPLLTITQEDERFKKIHVVMDDVMEILEAQQVDPSIALNGLVLSIGLVISVLEKMGYDRTDLISKIGDSIHTNLSQRDLNLQEQSC